MFPLAFSINECYRRREKVSNSLHGAGFFFFLLSTLTRSLKGWHHFLVQHPVSIGFIVTGYQWYYLTCFTLCHICLQCEDSKLSPSHAKEVKNTINKLLVHFIHYTSTPSIPEERGIDWWSLYCTFELFHQHRATAWRSISMF